MIHTVLRKEVKPVPCVPGDSNDRPFAHPSMEECPSNIYSGLQGTLGTGEQNLSLFQVVSMVKVLYLKQYISNRQ